MSRILVTGAGGFIGGRVVELLKEQPATDVNVLLRNISKGARISRYPLNFYKGDIIDKDAVEKAMDGCEAVVHCAHDFLNAENNIRAIDMIADLSLKKGIKKLVYISSFAVHKTNDREEITESTANNEEWDYALNKKEVEERLKYHFNQSGLPVVILRPTIVYGPFAGAWTIGIVNQMLENRMVLPYEGKRFCNAVYIDDVAGAIIRALRSGPECHGKAYLVSGPDTVSWKDFFDAYRSYQGTQEIVLMEDQDSRSFYENMRETATNLIQPTLTRDPISFLKKTPVYTLYLKLLKTNAFKKRLLSAKANIRRPLLYPSKESFEMMSCSGKVNLEKLETELGYHPKFSFEKGMSKTVAYLQWANLNCN